MNPKDLKDIIICGIWGVSLTAVYFMTFLFLFAWLDREYNVRKIYNELHGEIQQENARLVYLADSIMPSAFKGQHTHARTMIRDDNHLK